MPERVIAWMRRQRLALLLAAMHLACWAVCMAALLWVLVQQHRHLDAASVLLAAGLPGLLLALVFALLFAGLWLLLQRWSHAVARDVDRCLRSDPFDSSVLTRTDPPSEFRPMMRSIDALCRRMSVAFVAEHNYTSLLAHELRAPLAAVQAQAQLAQVVTSRKELTDSLRMMLQALNRTVLMMDQLRELTRIARLGRDARPELAPINLGAICRKVVSELEQQGMASGFTLKVELDTAHADGLPFACGLLMRNVIVNAIQHIPQGGHIEVRVERSDQGATFTVDDTGSGIREEDRERAFAQFDRLGRSSGDGLGLGLSIVRSIAEVHHAEVWLLGADLGGLRVQVRFPPPSDGR